ncbi:hypothetical protein NECID01_1245 [Nematocida sp. AWRm77]|nr:hypothetical protein NECID01_1245 [Nematocida sp. AWRm77]
METISTKNKTSINTPKSSENKAQERKDREREEELEPSKEELETPNRNVFKTPRVLIDSSGQITYEETDVKNESEINQGIEQGVQQGISNNMECTKILHDLAVNLSSMWVMLSAFNFLIVFFLFIRTRIASNLQKLFKYDISVLSFYNMHELVFWVFQMLCCFLYFQYAAFYLRKHFSQRRRNQDCMFITVFSLVIYACICLAVDRYNIKQIDRNVDNMYNMHNEALQSLSLLFISWGVWSAVNLSFFSDNEFFFYTEVFSSPLDIIMRMVGLFTPFMFMFMGLFSIQILLPENHSKYHICSDPAPYIN